MMKESPMLYGFLQFCTIMLSGVRTYSAEEIKPLIGVQTLQQQLLRFSFFNLFLVATLGLLLRTIPLLSSFPLDYKNLLHGHSHFAFGGWVFPILLWMILNYFPQLQEKIGFHHWRNISVLSLVAAYGMLLSFPLEGYAAISISFSTLSIIAGYYLAVVIWKATKEESEKTSIRFLRAGLFYMVLSSIGPFATGPIIALGKMGTPIYHNAIYFYLHFQYNGLFTFVVLAVLYALLERYHVNRNGNKVFWIFTIACIPSYFLSVLWNEPGAVFYIIGGMAAVVQLAGVYFLVQDFKHLKLENKFVQLLFSLAMVAFVLKNTLQLAGAFPSVASMAYHTRNFIIAYLHLVLLGFVSLFAFASVLKTNVCLVNPFFKLTIALFLASFLSTELVLVLQALAFIEAAFTPLMAMFTVFLPLSVFFMFRSITKTLQPF